MLLPREEHRNIYIELGANWANTLRLHHDVEQYIRHKHPTSAAHLSTHLSTRPFEVYAFEAAPHIHPYLEAFVDHLNRGSLPPCLTIPPAGSSWVLAEYAFQYGCCGDVRPADTFTTYFRRAATARCGTFHCCPLRQYVNTTSSLESCMYDTFKMPLHAVVAAVPGDTVPHALLEARMAEAAQPNTGTQARYTFVPAAAGGAAGSLKMNGVTAMQLIHGGLSSSTSHAPNGHPAQRASKSLEAAKVNVASWLQHFHANDFVILKMDIEGAEFELVDAMLALGMAKVIDIVLWECHGWAGDCAALKARFSKANPRLLWIPEHSPLYKGYDSFSSPNRLKPLDPRIRAQDRNFTEANCKPVY